NRKGNTQGDLLVYEWGDSIQVAAWGAMDPANPNPPQVTFTVTSRSGSRSYPATAVIDGAYNGPALVIDPAGPNPVPGVPWVAKVSIQIAPGDPNFSFSPGDRYTVFAEASINSATASLVTIPRLALGQFVPQPRPGDPNVDPNRTGEPPRRMAIANP